MNKVLSDSNSYGLENLLASGNALASGNGFSSGSTELARSLIEKGEYLRKWLYAKDKNKKLSSFCDAVSPLPFLVSDEHFALQKRLQKILCRTISRIVDNYPLDSRLEKLFNLPRQLRRIFNDLKGCDYQIGSYRPDFLHTESNDLLICEINARFPSNGFLFTHYCNQLLLPASARLNIMELLTRRFVTDAPVYLIKGREKGIDIHFLESELVQAGFEVSFLSPEQVLAGALEASLKSSLESSTAPALNAVLELHQDELADNKMLEKLSILYRKGSFYNDLRSIFLAHDKRMLAAFHRDDLLEDYCDKDDRAFLKDHVVATYEAADHKIAREAIADKNNWLLKPSLFGKGEGIVIGKNCDHRVWEKQIEEAGRGAYVLQRFIKQRSFAVCKNYHSNSDTINFQEMKVVGTMLCFDDVFLGPGIYRASASEIINVANGGSILAPVYQSRF